MAVCDNWTTGPGARLMGQCHRLDEGRARRRPMCALTICMQSKAAHGQDWSDVLEERVGAARKSIEFHGAQHVLGLGRLEKHAVQKDTRRAVFGPISRVHQLKSAFSCAVIIVP